MQRLTAIITLIAFFLINSLPVFAEAPMCMHASHTQDNSLDTENMPCHDMQNVKPLDIEITDMDMSDMSMAIEPVLTAINTHHITAQQPAKTISETPYCRIECGCGCNNKPDTFPIVLTPYLPAVFKTTITIIETRVAAIHAAPLITLTTPPSIPPPRNT